MIHGVNQYSLGLAGGYIVDYIFGLPFIPEDSYWSRLLKQLLQAGVNGFVIKNMLEFIHGANPDRNYRDPTGGYLMLMGFIQSQPDFMRDGKHLVETLTENIKMELFEKARNADNARAADNVDQ